MTTATQFCLIVRFQTFSGSSAIARQIARDARRVGHREVVARVDRHLRLDFDLAAEVQQEGAVGDVQHLDALEPRGPPRRSAPCARRRRPARPRRGSSCRARPARGRSRRAGRPAAPIAAASAANAPGWFPSRTRIVALKDADGWTADTSRIVGGANRRPIGPDTDCNADDYCPIPGSVRLPGSRLDSCQSAAARHARRSSRAPISSRLLRPGGLRARRQRRPGRACVRRPRPDALRFRPGPRARGANDPARRLHPRRRRLGRPPAAPAADGDFRPRPLHEPGADGGAARDRQRRDLAADRPPGGARHGDGLLPPGLGGADPADGQPRPATAGERAALRRAQRRHDPGAGARRRGRRCDRPRLGDRPGRGHVRDQRARC